MNAQERDRLTEAYRSILDTLGRFAELKLASQLIGGEDAHKGRASKRAVQKTMILLDKFEYLEKVLRADRDVCPHCGDNNHTRHDYELSAKIRNFAEEVSNEEFNCTECWDLGWLHIFVGDCQYGDNSDGYSHIEKCPTCNKLYEDRDAVLEHARDCGCPYFKYDCEHYNDSDFVEDAHQSDSTHVPLMLKESNEVMSTTQKPPIEEKFQDVGIRFSAPDDLPIITLPDGMEYDQAIHWLKKNRDELEKEISVDHKFPGFYPPDAALALHKAIERTYGFVSQERRPSGWSIIPPETIGIESELGKVVQIPWGRMTFHGVKGYVQTGVSFDDGNPVMQLNGVIRKGDQAKIEKLVLLTKEILRNESIYRGKAINIDFDNFDPETPKFNPMKAPKFIDLSKVKVEDLILSTDIAEQVDTNLFVPIREAQQCRDAGIPLRRGVLLAGPFGTGKSLTALVSAVLCVQHGWTYIYINKLEQLPQALRFAKNYGPAVLFGEDIDRITDGERDETLDEYLNSMDGIDRKHDEVMVVFTTNNVDNIHPAMMRPGRIDAIIHIEPPDAGATVKLLYKYGGKQISENANLTKVSNMIAGHTPAIVREVVERSKIRAVRDARGGKPVITEIHLEQAAKEMLSHVKYINKEDEVERHPLEVLGTAIGERIGAAAMGHGPIPLRDALRAGDLPNVLNEAAKEGLADLKNGNGTNGSVA